MTKPTQGVGRYAAAWRFLAGGIAALAALVSEPMLHPVAAQQARPYQYNAPEARPSYGEAPGLAAAVAAGNLPPVADRLPANPAVVVPHESIGKYGGHVRTHLWDFSWWWLVARSLAHADLVRQQGGNSGIFEPDLAERWELSEDGTVWTFHLRDGVKWSDGTPFTTEDIMFWYQHVLQNKDLMPGTPAWLRPGNQLAQFEALDGRTLRITFAQPNRLFLFGLTQGTSTVWTNWVNHPKHYMSRFHPDFVASADLEAKVSAAGIGNWIDLYRRETEPHTASAGRPYLWAWTPDGPIDAEGRWAWSRNPYFYKIDEAGNQLPYIDTWSTTKVTDNESVILGTIGGQFDFVVAFVRGNNIPAVRDAIQRGAPLQIINNINAKPGEVSIYINYTVDDAVLRDIFADVRFRQALSLAIDREEASEARFRGFSQASQACVPAQDPFIHDPDWCSAFVAFDPDRANALLDSMGLTARDSAGFRLRPDGHRLTLILDYQAGNHVQALELLPEYMKRIGIDLQLQPAASGLFLERNQTNSVQLAGWSFQPNFYRPDLFLPGPRGTNNRWGVLWSNWYATGGAQGEEPTGDVRELYALVDAAQVAGTLEERVDLLKKVVALHKANLWVIGLAGMDVRPHVAHKDLRNIPGAPYGLNVDPSQHSEYSETWYWNR